MESTVQFCAGSMMAKYRDEGKTKIKQTPPAPLEHQQLYFYPSPVEDFGHPADIK